MSKRKQVVLKVVVNGWPMEIQQATAATWRSLIPLAIERAGQTGRPAADWEIRNEAGALIDLDQKIGRFDTSIRLFLNLRAGIFGNAA